MRVGVPGIIIPYDAGVGNASAINDRLAGTLVVAPKYSSAVPGTRYVISHPSFIAHEPSPRLVEA